MDIFSEDTDSETEEIAVTSLEPYQFEPPDAYSSDSDELSEDECTSSDEESVWWYELVQTLDNYFVPLSDDLMSIQVSLWKLQDDVHKKRMCMLLLHWWSGS